MSVYVGIDVHRKRSQVAVLPALQPSFQEHRSDCKPGLNSSGERAQVRPRCSREHRRSRYLADAVAGSVARDVLVHAGQDVAQQGLSRRIVRRSSGGPIADYLRGLDAGGVRPPLTAARAVTVRMPAGRPGSFRW